MELNNIIEKGITVGYTKLSEVEKLFLKPYLKEVVWIEKSNTFGMLYIRTTVKETILSFESYKTMNYQNSTIKRSSEGYKPSWFSLQDSEKIAKKLKLKIKIIPENI